MPLYSMANPNTQPACSTSIMAGLSTPALVELWSLPSDHKKGHSQLTMQAYALPLLYTKGHLVKLLVRAKSITVKKRREKKCVPALLPKLMKLPFKLV